MSTIPTCCVTGAIPGDGGACGDCDPCIGGEPLVPEAVKRLIAEKNSLLNQLGDLMEWRPIETAPKDVDVLLGWWRTWPERQWECAAGLAGSTKGGWLHGQATHWMPLPIAPSL